MENPKATKEEAADYARTYYYGQEFDKQSFVDFSISKRAAKLDYPKKMYEDMAKWIEENSEQLKRKLLIIKGKDSIKTALV